MFCLYVENGITDDNFYSDPNKIETLLKNYSRFEEFKVDYEIQRSSIDDLAKSTNDELNYETVNDL